METAPETETAADARPRLHGRRLSDGRHLYWWVELAFIVSFYAIYSTIRNTNEGGELAAFNHAKQVIRWEQAISLYFEEAWQDWALGFRPIVIAMNYIYGSLHFLVTGGAIIYLFRRHSDDYPLWRNTLAITTGLALIGFVLWPLMPPRLLPDAFGYVDTLARYPTFWSFDSGAMNRISNQYAAMPSLHFAWSSFCAFSLAPRVGQPWVKWALVSYPAVTLIAIVLTGNHYWLDAVGGAIVFVLGLAIARKFTRAGRGEPVPADAA